MRFSKWHALGNSYLVVERDDAGSLTPDRASRLCDVDRGLGSDGVLEVVGIVDSEVEVVIWNPDGSTAEMSGNGTRIAAAWLAQRLGATALVVRVGSRRVPAVILEDGTVETVLGAVEVGEAETLDVDGSPVELTRVTVGNPHAVVVCDELSREMLLRLGPQLESHPRFPGRTNVQLSRADGKHDVHALVWERGAGETSASGSSAVAVAAAMIGRAHVESPVTVHMPGGDLLVRISVGQATLIGPAEQICTGETAGEI